jgi:hypothetical protein
MVLALVSLTATHSFTQGDSAAVPDHVTKRHLAASLPTSVISRLR